MFTDLFQLEQKPVTVFSSADAGAPTLTNTPGSLKTILKACLVTGYGSKASLGWEMEFESEDQLKAAFKSTDPTASRFYFKIDNSGASSALLSGYQEMSSIDVGTKSIVVDNLYNLYSSSWKLIGHSKAFILLLDIPGRSTRCAFPILFGDLPRETKRVAPLCVLWSGRRTYNIGSVQSTLFYTPNGSTASATNSTIVQTPNYPFRVNSDQSAENLTANYGRFQYQSTPSAAVLYEPVLSRLTDSTWTMIPMIQPLSTPGAAVDNLGQMSDIGIKAVTGDYNDPTSNVDCIVPTTWWYA